MTWHIIKLTVLFADVLHWARNNVVSFRHAKADFLVIWGEQQSGSAGHCGHSCCGCLLGLVCLVVYYDAQADASIHLQSNTGM